MFLTPSTVYTFTASDANGNQIWVATYVDGTQVTQAIIGQLLWPQNSAEQSAGVTPSYYNYPPGDARRYGADPTGTNASDSAFAQMFSVLGTDDYVIDGIFKLATGNIVIPAGATVRWTSESVVNYTGSGSCFLISNSKEITLWRANVSMAGAGSSAIAFDIAGVWFLNVHAPRVAGTSSTNNQIAFQIQTSRSGGDNYGAFNIQFFNPDFATSSNLGYGISTLQTSGDSIYCTHLDVFGGWSSYVTYPLYFRQLSTGHVIGFTPEQCTDGINVGGACNNLYLQPGEMDCSGYGINFPDATCQNIVVASPSLSGTATSGLINTTNYTPILVNVAGELRLYASGAEANYFVSYKSNNIYSGAMTETINGGGTARVVRSYGDASGHQLNYVFGISGTTTAANNLRGTATFASATSVAVAFGTAESDDSYTIALGGNAAGYCWVTTKATTGFTINCSASNSNAVDWHLIR